MSIPFHKQTNPNKQAGQVVFSPVAPKTVPGLCLDSGEFIPAEELNDSHKQETTLAQYIKRKTDEPKRITFDEWLAVYNDDLTYTWGTSDLRMAWNTALKQGKL